MRGAAAPLVLVRLRRIIITGPWDGALYYSTSRHGESADYMGLPLAQELDRYLTRDGRLIACSWHGALFRIADGQCVGGPCSGTHLQPWPVTVQDGDIVTV